MVGIFDYIPKGIRPKIRFEQQRNYFKERVLSFPSVIKTPYQENNTVYLYLYQPLKQAKNQCVILIHSLSERKNGPTHGIAKTLTKNGFLSCLMTLPYHIRRTPKGKRNGSLYLTTNIKHSIQSVIQSIIDLRCCLDYLENLTFIDPSKIGAVGLSLGGILIHTLMGVDKRIKAGVSILGGGDLNDIVIKGIATIPLKIQAIIKGVRFKHYRKVKKEFEIFLQEVRKVKTIEKIKPPWEWFLLDPLTYAHLNQPRKVLFINGRFDLVIPRVCVTRLWEELGHPPIIWLPTGHFTARLWSSYITKKTIQYLKQNL